HITTLNGHLEVARCLLSAGADLGRRNADGGSALHVAAWTGNLDLMKLLFAAGADPEKPQNEGWTPLHIASRNGHAQIVQWLLFDLGVNAYQRVDAGWKLCLKSSAS
ncbi:fem1c, partial [Symbiodinium necroappetens]